MATLAVSSFFQIFKDGASYQGCMKCMAHNIVKFHYKDALELYINFSHNSDQCAQVISNNVKSLNWHSYKVHLMLM